MLFNSLHFLLFFIITTLIYYVIPHKHRWLLLLLISCYFYMVFVPIYILILGFTIIIDYYAGIWIEQEVGNRRKLYLIISLVTNIGILAIFKYYNFINTNITTVIGTVGYQNPVPFLSILLPIGLSFHTFQAMSYTIEVYRGKQKAEKHFGIYALYVMFYPQLVAGPIERPQNILPQLRKPIAYDENLIIEGIQMMIWGLFKKVVVADRLSVLVDTVYSNPNGFGGFANLLAAVFFSIQIYCDFSGYSDIALGTAKVLGFDLIKNFNIPYISKSINEFWQRWHISLSTWFRDYLYISLGGNRNGKWKTYRNVLAVFMISGLWHGANWTFVIWGTIHGILIIIERLLKIDKFKTNNKIIQILQTSITFGIVTGAWIFFRAKNVNEAFSIYKAIFTRFSLNKAAIIEPIFAITSDNTAISHFIVCLIGILILFFVEFKMNIQQQVVFADKPRKQMAFYSMIIFLILFLGYFKNNTFIYFQF